MKRVGIEPDASGVRGRWIRVATVKVPTRQGWAALVSFAMGVVVLVVFGIYPFLAVTEPVGGGLLVVEGWLHDPAIPSVLEIFDQGAYAAIATTGGDVLQGSYLGEHDNYAEVMALSLKAARVPAGKVHAIPAVHVDTDRTYASALALRGWLTENRGVTRNGIDVVTEGAHARRSRLLFQMALGQDVQVGIISLPPAEYEADGWWRSSGGVRSVIGETIAYLYVKVLFWP